MASTTPALDAPRSPKEPTPLRRGRTSRSGRTNFELYSWMFMRFSGLLLTFLVLGHLLIMLWLATLHGTNGLRTVINDYAERNATRITLKTLLYTASIWMIFLGSLVIFTFDPNIKA